MTTATIRLPCCWRTSRNSCSWTCRRRTGHVCGQSWPMKLFLVVYRGHEFTAINPSSHVLLRVRLVFFNSAYLHAGIHVRCTPTGRETDRVSHVSRGMQRRIPRDSQRFTDRFSDYPRSTKNWEIGKLENWEPPALATFPS